MRSIIFAATLLAPVTGLAGPKELLQKLFDGPSVACMLEESSNLTLNGTSFETRVQVFYNGKGSARREYLGGPADSIVLLTVGASTWQKSDSRWTMLPEAEGPSAGQRIDLILKNYRVTAGKPVQRLGRSVVPLHIEARHSHQPTRKVLIEERTGLRLEDVLIGFDGKTRSASSVTSVQMVTPAPSLFDPPKDATSVSRVGPTSFQRVTREEMEAKAGRQAPVPRYLPSGFVVADFGLVQAGSGRMQPAVRYQDGLASFTIFSRGRMAGRGRGRGRSMQSNEQRAVVETQGSQGSYLLIGDLPEAVLRRVADSLS